MKFLKTSTDVKNQISRMLPKCAKLRWAVAWASHEKCPLFDLLYKHRHKIHQATIGIHFYQTHPDFIETFIDHKAVTFVMKPKGVFHPKLYFFEFENGDWECICGSPNFTKSAFSDNAEVAVLFGNADLDAPSAKSDIIAVLDDFKAMGERLTAKQLAEYRSIWQRQQVRLKSLSGELGGNGKPTPSPFERPLIVAEWPEYLSWVKEDKVHSTEGRLAVLEQAHKLFTADIQFNKMGDLDRKRIAGCVDYSVAKGGFLCAYRWNGEQKLSNENFVWVKR